MDSRTLQIILQLKDDATSGLQKLGQTLTANKETFQQVGLAAGIAFAGVTAAIAGSVSAANESAKVQAQLDAVLKSTGDTQAHVVQQFVATGGTITTTLAQSSKQIAAHATAVTDAQSKIHGYQEQLQAATAKLADLTAAQAAGTLKTNAQKESLVLTKEKITDLNNEIAKATGTMTVHGKTATTLAGYYKDVTVAAQFTRQGLIDLSKQLEQTTTFSDETVLSAENLLLTFTSIGANVMPQATKTVLDMAQALGEDTKDAAIQLGKALQDPVLGITALRRVGVNFTDDQKNVIAQLVKTGQSAKAQQLILAELNKEFGGSAAAAATTFGGRMEQVKNQIDDLQEEIGNAIIPILSKFLEKIVPIISAMTEWMIAHPKLTAAILLTVAAVTGLTAALSALALVTIAFETVAWPVVAVVAAIAIGIIALIAVGVLLYQHWDQIKSKAMEVFNFLGDFFTAFWQNLADIATFTMNLIVGAIITDLNALLPGWQGVLAAISKAWSDMWSGVLSFFTGVWNTVKDTIGGAVDYVINKIDGLIAKAQEIAAKVLAPIGKAVAAVGGGASSIGSSINSAISSVVGTGASVTHVNDAIITPSGQVIQTHPDDYLFATKTPGSLGGGSNVTININGGSYLDTNGARMVADLFAKSIGQQLKVRAI